MAAVRVVETGDEIRERRGILLILRRLALPAALGCCLAVGATADVSGVADAESEAPLVLSSRHIGMTGEDLAAEQLRQASPPVEPAIFITPARCSVRLTTGPL